MRKALKRYTPAANTTSGGVFVYQEFPIAGADGADAVHSADDHGRAVRLQVGGRLDVLRIASAAGDPKFGPPRTRAFQTFSGSAGANARLAERVTVGVSAARSFRTPSVEELFSNAYHAAVGTYDIGNPDLRPEINQGLDAVLRAERGRLSGQLSAYYNRVADFIGPRIVGDTVLAAANGAVAVNRFTQADARLYGAEGRVEGVVGRRLILGASGDLVRGAFVVGGALPFLPPARLGSLARWDDGRRALGVEVRHGFAQERTSQPGCPRAATVGGAAPLERSADNGVPCLDRPTGAYTVLHVSASANVIRGGLVHALTLRVDNVLDASYVDAASRIKSFAWSPGRNVSLVYRVLY